MCQKEKSENWECWSKTFSIEFEIFHALFSFLEGFLSQYLVLKSNVLAKRRLCHFVAMETGLFAYALFGLFSGREPVEDSNFLMNFQRICPLGD